MESSGYNTGTGNLYVIRRIDGKGKTLARILAETINAIQGFPCRIFIKIVIPNAYEFIGKEF